MCLACCCCCCCCFSAHGFGTVDQWPEFARCVSSQYPTLLHMNVGVFCMAVCSQNLSVVGVNIQLKVKMEAHAFGFNDVCTFESFQKVWKHYGYSGDLEEMRREQFARMKGMTYLDHAGTTLFPQSQIKGFSQDLAENVYGNPHSHNPSSRLTHDTVERVRYRILQHFNTCPEEYTVVFTSGSTAALKLVAESFPWRPADPTEPGSLFCYLTDNHTSVVGIRGVASQLGVPAIPVQLEEVEQTAQATSETNGAAREGNQTPHLFCYPAQSNFSGRKYPLCYVKGIQCGKLYPSTKKTGRWCVLLDAACLASCSLLDLQAHPADFVPISFYKIFGFPTGLGALLIRNDTAGILRKVYFGGGTASAYLAGQDYFVPKASVASRFEDGTISFLDIIALNHGFEALEGLTGGMNNIKLHTFGLARYTYILLSSLLHGNGLPVVQIYSDTTYDDPDAQGPIINFNVLDAKGEIIGYSQVDKLASLFNIQVRTGCFCNTGACQRHLGISDQAVKDNLQAGHECGDNVDLVNGQPTGSVRISFGYMSTFQDCQTFLKFVVDSFVQGPVRVDEERLASLRAGPPVGETAHRPPAPCCNGLPEAKMDTEGSGGVGKTPSDCVREERVPTAAAKALKSEDVSATLTNIFLYPIKSCAAVEVREWPLGQSGLLYDRSWMVVNVNGVCLSQKQEPRLCLIRPHVSLQRSELSVSAEGMDTISIPLEGGPGEQQTQQVCQSKVCGDRVQTLDCGEEVSAWLSEFLGKQCRLIRQRSQSRRDMRKGRLQGEQRASLSLVNEAPYLMINRASLQLVQDHIANRVDSGVCQQFSTEQLIDRFRANLVVSGAQPFEEDDWTRLMIGHTPFQVVGRCGRCQMIGIDQETGARSREPLQSLSACRDGKVTFGIYLLHQPSGQQSTLSVGFPIIPEVASAAADLTVHSNS
ncbi:molybdenum cofactor sulfurase isoform X2 [Amia ocellicauda]|uniref:molybdenum cofactor sulfurase isoform X2 n=1 Tax=Amia ocellicauda TaxID=2972642 RepID=UPI0034641B19